MAIACRVLAKRLRDVCVLPESEPLWRAGHGFVIRDLPERARPRAQQRGQANRLRIDRAHSSQDIAAAGDGRTPPSIL